MYCQSLCTRESIFFPEAISNGVTYADDLVRRPGAKVAFEVIHIPPHSPALEKRLADFAPRPRGHWRSEQLLDCNVRLRHPAGRQIEDKIGDVKLAFFENAEVSGHLG